MLTRFYFNAKSRPFHILFMTHSPLPSPAFVSSSHLTHSSSNTSLTTQVQDSGLSTGSINQSLIQYHLAAQSRRNHNYADTMASVLTMPIPGTKVAPEKFRGDFHKVKEFVQHYERLCLQHNVTLDTERCETILRYCSKRERQTIMNIPSFIAHDWNRLRADVLKLYDADLATKRYKVRDVRNFSRKQKGKHVRDLAEWRKYCRAFL